MIADELEAFSTDHELTFGARQHCPPALWISESSQRFGGFNELAKVKFPEYTPNNGFVAAFEALIEEIETGKPSSSTGRDGRLALKIILALYQSAAKGGRKMRLR